MHKPILNISEAQLAPWPDYLRPVGPAALRYGAHRLPIGERIGARQLGYCMIELAPGKRAFPYHNHRVNEEMFFILEGSGELRIGGRSYAIRAGDFIACPAGGTGSAHQIVNSGALPMRYLAVSTRFSPEVVEYPDSHKFAVLVESAPGGAPRDFLFNGRQHGAVGYWDDE